MFFLVPHPFKIEAFLQNSLSLQCTYLCNSWRLSVYGLDVTLTRCVCLYRCWPTTGGRPQSRRGLCQHFYNVVTVSTKHIVHKNTAAPEYVGGGKDGDWVLPIVKLKGISINLEREFVSTHRGVCWSHVQKQKGFFFFCFFLNMHIVTLTTHIWSWSLLTCRQKPLDLQQQLSLKLVRPAFGTV